MKEHAHLRTRSQRPSLPHRSSAGVGCRARALRRTPGCPGAGCAATLGGSACHAYGGHARGRRCRGVDLGGRATGSGGAHRSGMRRGWREGRSIGRRVGCGSGDSAGVRARTQARAGGISGCESAALVVFAGIRVQRAGISSRRAAGDRASMGAGAGSGRESCRCPVRAFRGRARVRHDELRYAHRHADAGRAGPAWPRQEREEGSAGGWAGRPGQRAAACLGRCAQLHEALDSGEGRVRPAQRTVVRDGGFWSPQLELDLDTAGYYSLISLPLGHKAAEEALQMAAQRGAMKPLSGKLSEVRAARIRTTVGELDRTLVVVESQELLAGQKRGIAAALRKAKVELRTLEGLIQKGRISRSRLELRVNKALAREHLSSFVVTTFAGSETAPTLHWHVDAALRRELEKTRLGRRVLCTDRHTWTTGRIVYAFRGQWKVEELFRRAKKGGVVPWGPSHQWADGSLRLHTFATVLGLMLVSLAKIALGTDASARQTMESLAEIKVTLVRTTTGGVGRRPTVMLAPELTTEQRRAVKVFELERWAPQLFHV